MKPQAKSHVAVVTGASSGIGKEAARALAGRGWKVIGLGRNSERCAEAEAEIRAQSDRGVQVNMIQADLSLMSDTTRAVKEIEKLTDRVNVLLNNAGGLTSERRITPEGNETTFASNHLGHFLLTTRLLPLLQAAVADSPPGATRIVNVSSSGHESCDGLDWNDLQMKDDFNSGNAYCRAKLANILFARQLAKRLAADGIVAHSMHPGVVSSNFANHGDEAMQRYIGTLEDVSQCPEVAADTLIWLATAEEPGKSSGQYFYQRKNIPPSPAAQDDAAAERLWRESEKLIEQFLARVALG